MRFAVVTLLALAGSAIAAPLVNVEDVNAGSGSDLKKAIDAITAATTAAGNAANSGNFNTLKAASNNVLNKIAAAKAVANGIKGKLSNTDGIAISGKVLDELVPAAKKTLDSIVSKKSKWVKDKKLGEVKADITNQRGRSDDLANAISGKLEDLLKAQAASVTGKINKAFNDALGKLN